MNTLTQKDSKRDGIKIMSVLENLGRIVLMSNNSKRKEYDFVWRHLSSCESILDVGCGVGLFIDYAPERIISALLRYDVRVPQSNACLSGIKRYTV